MATGRGFVVRVHMARVDTGIFEICRRSLVAGSLKLPHLTNGGFV